MEKLDRLFRVLRKDGLWRGEEIQRELGISQPVMSRLLHEAGSGVFRFGRSVVTRYALLREIASLGFSAPVFRVDEHGRPNRYGPCTFSRAVEAGWGRESGSGQLFPGLPPFVEDIRPQGYIAGGGGASRPSFRNADSPGVSQTGMMTIN